MSPTEVSINPLLEGFAPFTPVSEMPAKLLHEPLANVQWRTTPPEMREQYLELHEEHFFPTGAATDIATRIHAAILGGLSRRNPLARAEQKRINELSVLQSDNIHILPSLANPATAGIISAKTGIGKTSIAKRTLEAIAPDQVIVHSRSEACGWSRLMQIAYLRLDFPSNGSRAGLIDHILGAIDALIGTEYVRCVRRRNLEAGLIEVMRQLSAHRVGLLVVDEIQPDTFDKSPFYRQFVLLMLCLVNLGIPLLLCGQPSGFSQLVDERQTRRRFSTIGLFELGRAESDEDKWWSSELAPGVVRFNMCEEVIGMNEIVARSRRMSAGVPGYFAQLWVEAQRLALRRGGDTATLTSQDLDKASKSRAIHTVMLDAQEIEAGAIQSRCSGEPIKSTPNASPESDGVSNARLRAADNDPDIVRKTVHKARANEERIKKREATKAARDAEYLKELAGDDLRNANRSMEILKNLDSAQPDLLPSAVNQEPSST